MKSKYFSIIDSVNDLATYPICREYPSTIATTTLEMPDINSKEDAFYFIRDLPELTQALLYKALHMNDMRIDRAETIIFKNRKD